MSQTRPSSLRDSAGSQLEELRQLLRHDLAATAPIAPFADDLQDLGHLKNWLVNLRGKSTPLKHPRLAFFAGVGADTKTFSDPQSPVCKLAAEINTDLQIYDLSAGAAQTTADHALAYGMMAVQPGLDALGAALIDNRAIEENLTLETLLASARHDLAAVLGAVIAARLARLPVVMPLREGVAIKNLLDAHHPQAGGHIVLAQEIISGAQNLPPTVAVAIALGQLRTAALL